MITYVAAGCQIVESSTLEEYTTEADFHLSCHQLANVCGISVRPKTSALLDDRQLSVG